MAQKPIKDIIADLQEIKTGIEKRNYINKNLTYDEMVSLIIHLTSESYNFPLEKLTVSAEIFNLMHSMIDDNFRIPDSKGRGRKPKLVTKESAEETEPNNDLFTKEN
jgi:hypothetical protein